MPTPDSATAQAQVDQAIDWLVKLRFDRPGPHTEQQFQQWLASHPHNALAWQRVSQLSDELAGLPKGLSRRTLDGSQRQRSRGGTITDDHQPVTPQRPHMTQRFHRREELMGILHP